MGSEMCIRDRPKEKWKRELRRGYSKLRPMEYLVDHGSLETSDSVSEEIYKPNIAIRCVGEHSSEGKIIPRMHHKFLVFCKRKSDQFGHFSIVPYAVWTGSFNMTMNGTSSFENALLVDSEEIAEAYFKEWQQLLLVSEKLNWSSSWVAPDIRINTGQFFT